MYLVSQRQRVVFIDHDGTLTDTAQETQQYSDIVIQYNADVLGMGFGESKILLDVAKDKILKKPDKYGWKWSRDGFIVAAASSDPYILNQVATDLMLTDLTASDAWLKRKIEGFGGNGKYVTDLYLSCAPKLGTYYRPEAREFLLKLSKSDLDWVIVTNSDAVKVSKKLSTLHLNFIPKVVGGAKKYEIDREWTALLPKGPYKGFKGYPTRGVELQRKTFYDVLARESGQRLSNLIFIEDVGEFVAWIDWLSESNPEWSGARTALMITPMTPEWEQKRYSGHHKTRFGSSSLLDIMDWISKQ